MTVPDIYLRLQTLLCIQDEIKMCTYHPGNKTTLSDNLPCSLLIAPVNLPTKYKANVWLMRNKKTLM